VCCLLALLYLRLAFRRDIARLELGPGRWRWRWDIAEWVMDYECMRVEDVGFAFCMALHCITWLRALVYRIGALGGSRSL
jgi:hypothetical protein